MSDTTETTMTMTFAMASLGTVGPGVVYRRDPGPFWHGPAYPYFAWLALPAVITWFGVELPLLQRWLDTTNLTGDQWLAVIALSLAAPVLVEVGKAFRR